jgi:hypothetical protein
MKQTLGKTTQMNIPATFGLICFSGSLEEDGRQVMAIAHMTLLVR